MLIIKQNKNTYWSHSSKNYFGLKFIYLTQMPVESKYRVLPLRMAGRIIQHCPLKSQTFSWDLIEEVNMKFRCDVEVVYLEAPSTVLCTWLRLCYSPTAATDHDASDLSHGQVALSNRTSNFKSPCKITFTIQAFLLIICVWHGRLT